MCLENGGSLNIKKQAIHLQESNYLLNCYFGCYGPVL